MILGKKINFISYDHQLNLHIQKKLKYLEHPTLPTALEFRDLILFTSPMLL